MPAIERPTVEGQIFNLSLGSVLAEGIRFSWTSEFLTKFCGHSVAFDAEIINNEELFANEKQLAAYHVMENKQNLGYNPRGAAATAVIRVTHDNFHSDHAHAFVHHGNVFIIETVAPILSFLQRRRILFSTLHFMPADQWVMALPMFLAGEWIDSVAFGPESTEPADLQIHLSLALSTYSSGSELVQGRIRMLLQRYIEILNLPYVHERVEGLWRILEALGRFSQKNERTNEEYRRLLNICGAKKSDNLELLLRALNRYSINYSDDEVLNSRFFRNHSTHEYLDPKLLSWETLPGCFYFLSRCVDIAISTELGLSESHLKPPRFSIIQNRVF